LAIDNGSLKDIGSDIFPEDLKGFPDSDEGVIGDSCICEFLFGCASFVGCGVMYPKVQKQMHCPKALASSDEPIGMDKLFSSFCLGDVIDECGMMKP
jgi:hypothetical protein